ncbi:MAG: hypothetical protein QGG40_17630, partial [Myxococcota bacterium]|nr:hypothetical protein [Myxococcota bacterium]
MPLVAIPIEFPADVVELRAGDVDGDDIDELLLIQRQRQGTRPDSVSFTIMNLDTSGTVEDRWSLDLGNRALFVDIESGLWGLAGDGVVRLDRHGIGTVLPTNTALADMGASTPTLADVFDDIEGDGTPEVVVALGPNARVISVDGTERANVTAPSRGELELRTRVGSQLVTSSVSPSWQLDDFDGDGVKDLLLPDGATLTVFRLGGEDLPDQLDVALPLSVAPRRPDGAHEEGRVDRDVQRAWLEDIDGDGRTDFLAQLWVTEGSWLDAEGELFFARGTGQGFAQSERIESDEAILVVQLVDLDGDDDRDLVTAQVDFGVGNLARALLSREVRIDLYLHEMKNGSLQTPVSLQEVLVPVGHDRDPAMDFTEDLTGDGLPDLVSNDG